MQVGVKILRLVFPNAGTQKPRLNNIHQVFFKGLAVALIEGKGKPRKGHHQNAEGGTGSTEKAIGEQVKRKGCRRRACKTHNLAFRQVQGHFGFYLRQIFGYLYIGHNLYAPFVGMKKEVQGRTSQKVWLKACFMGFCLLLCIGFWGRLGGFGVLQCLLDRRLLLLTPLNIL